jgi:hypothetical protein
VIWIQVKVIWIQVKVIWMGDGKDYCRLAISDKMYKADVEVDKS